MRNEPKIRFAQKKDLPNLIDLCTLHASFEKAEYEANGKKKLLDKYLFSNNPSLFCLVVEDESQLIGYATYMKQFSTWDACHYIYMDCLFLTEESRGYGLGEKLIERIKKETQQLGCKLIQWQTPVFNTRAMKFYERIGAFGKSKERYFLKVK
ncbi:GNAT family N-acetyltransferase [Cryomorphaceae bacterium 1068]|nr:GNAT family N-acetyltransferase [Cryomorphaceae bacterium 1068]